jgi:negative modulator of initiation of replication
MKAIQVSDDFYLEIRKRSLPRESDEEVIMRLIGVKALATPAPIASSTPIGFKVTQPKATTPLSKFLESPQFLVKSNAVGKFKEILSWLYRQDKIKFTAVTEINGSKRRYFGEFEALDHSGENVMAQSIPGTPYFVVTNNDTPKKRRMLGDVMRVLGYDQADVARAKEAIK